MPLSNQNSSNNDTGNGFEDFFAKTFLDSLQDGYWLLGGNVGVARLAAESDTNDNSDDGFYNFFKTNSQKKLSSRRVTTTTTTSEALSEDEDEK